MLSSWDRNRCPVPQAWQPLMAVFVVADPAIQQGKVNPPVATSSLLSRLRLETRDEHEAVEQVLDLMSESLTRQIYCQRLEQFYGFYAPLERALQARTQSLVDKAGKFPLSDASFAALAVRLDKTAHLQQDLHRLGVPTHALPLCRDLPSLSSQAELLGCMYVMEGATLGGRMITQHVRATLGVTPMTGGSFFDGYGDDTARMWQGMRQLLVSASSDTETENAIVINAIATFASLLRWCETFPTIDRKKDHSSCVKT